MPVLPHLASCGTGAFVLLLGCTRPLPPAQLSTTVTDSAGIPIITLSRPIAEVALGIAGTANNRATSRFHVDSLTHPVAVAILPSGGIAILDRAEGTVTIVDSLGGGARVVGRQGAGPGEVDVGAGIIEVGGHLVVLQSSPSNTLVRVGEGREAHSVAEPTPGDWGGLRWQRPDIGLEFPLQSAPELWSRRLRRLDDSTFLAYVGPVNGDTALSATAHLLRFGADLELRDTFATLPAVRRELRPASDPRGAPQLYQRIWAPRTVWTAADDEVVLGASHRPRLELRSADGDLEQLITWRAAALPVTKDDRMLLGEQIAKVTIAVSPGAAENAARMSAGDRRAMMTEFVATLAFAEQRPEITALFLSDRCVWVAGFDPADDADGTAHEWLLLDLDAPSAPPRVVTIGALNERVVALARGMAATIALNDDGSRRVTLYAIPSCRSAA